MSNSFWKRFIVHTSLIGTLVLPVTVSAQSVVVKPADSLYLLSKQHGVSIETIKLANRLTSDTIYDGSKLFIPPKSQIHVVQSGDTLWKLSNKYKVSIDSIMEATQLASTKLDIGQKLLIPVTGARGSSSTGTSSGSASSTDSNKGSNSGTNANGTATTVKPWVEYVQYVVKDADTSWTIAIDHGIPMEEFLQVNRFTEDTILYGGESVKIPVHHIPVTPTPGPQFGEYLDWFDAVQYLFPINATAVVTDFKTGTTFKVKRVIGAFHSDTEPLTADDAAIMKSVWGGEYSWQTRSVIVETGGRRIAGSMTSMPHSIDFIKDNKFDGHFDIHFLNSLRHADGLQDPKHQAAIKVAAGK